jgi:hypothetical protein
VCVGAGSVVLWASELRKLLRRKPPRLQITT